MRVLIPRGGEWGDEVARLVTEAGFEPLILPLVTIEPAEDQEPLQRALAQLAEGRFDWLVLTSRSAVRVLPRVPASVRVAAVGAVTAAALRERGVPVSFVPTRQSAGGLVDEWPARSGSVLWPRALDAKPTVADGLRERGMEVTDVVAYRTVPAFESTAQLAGAVDRTGTIPTVDPERLRDEQLATARDGVDGVLTAVEPAETPIHAVLVTSGSVARQVARLGLRDDVRVIAIGDQTAEDCRRHGLRVAAIAHEPNAPALVAALVAAAR
ncbi:uroporphyrinogen-III synthase [Agrococcus sp. HG114]|uniref:uroporphyrinogen-III synthase n=1 Tax=Agrococcus sp. HG114 TaxID=2969757 RepID=UPI00215B73B3|nr:uroporphyrinogen-III synthase [Agrococcus sp. HG114]MCR8671135.1 uroporphyrinogen-III synthase [Agrococcus sp. HG114]